MKKEGELFLVYPLIVTTDYQSKVRRGKPLYFSEYERAETMIKTFKESYAFLYNEAIQGERVYCLVMDSYLLNVGYRYQLSTRVYSPEGMLLNDCLIPDEEPFYGRPSAAIQHNIGDFVEIPCGDRLLIGIVAGQPLCLNEAAKPYGLKASDDCYTVIQHPELMVHYAHAPMVFKPSRQLDERVCEVLESALTAYIRQDQDDCQSMIQN